MSIHFSFIAKLEASQIFRMLNITKTSGITTIRTWTFIDLEVFSAKTHINVLNITY